MAQISQKHPVSKSSGYCVTSVCSGTIFRNSYTVKQTLIVRDHVHQQSLAFYMKYSFSYNITHHTNVCIELWGQHSLFLNRKKRDIKRIIVSGRCLSIRFLPPICFCIWGNEHVIEMGLLQDFYSPYHCTTFKADFQPSNLSTSHMVSREQAVLITITLGIFLSPHETGTKFFSRSQCKWESKSTSNSQLLFIPTAISGHSVVTNLHLKICWSFWVIVDSPHAVIVLSIPICNVQLPRVVFVCASNLIEPSRPQMRIWP